MCLNLGNIARLKYFYKFNLLYFVSSCIIIILKIVNKNFKAKFNYKNFDKNIFNDIKIKFFKVLKCDLIENFYHKKFDKTNLF